MNLKEEFHGSSFKTMGGVKKTSWNIDESLSEIVGKRKALARC